MESIGVLGVIHWFLVAPGIWRMSVVADNVFGSNSTAASKISWASFPIFSQPFYYRFHNCSGSLSDLLLPFIPPLIANINNN